MIWCLSLTEKTLFLLKMFSSLFFWHLILFRFLPLIISNCLFSHIVFIATTPAAAAPISRNKRGAAAARVRLDIIAASNQINCFNSRIAEICWATGPVKQIPLSPAALVCSAWLDAVALRIDSRGSSCVCSLFGAEAGAVYAAAPVLAVRWCWDALWRETRQINLSPVDVTALLRRGWRPMLVVWNTVWLCDVGSEPGAERERGEGVGSWFGALTSLRPVSWQD